MRLDAIDVYVPEAICLPEKSEIIDAGLWQCIERVVQAVRKFRMLKTSVLVAVMVMGSILLVTPSGEADSHHVQIKSFALPHPESYPQFVSQGPHATLWFTEQAGRIGQLQMSGHIKEISASTFGTYPYAITSGPDDDLWYTAIGANGAHVQLFGRVTGHSNTAYRLAPTVSRAYTSLLPAIIKGPDGNIWFTEPGAGLIGKATPSGRLTEFPILVTARQQVLPPVLAYPEALTVGPQGDLWFTENRLVLQRLEQMPDTQVLHDLDYTHQIGRITVQGRISEFPVAVNGYLESIASGPDGDIWFTLLNPDPVHHQIGRMTPSGRLTWFTLPEGNQSASYLTPGTASCQCLWFLAGASAGGYPWYALGRITTTGAVREFALPPGLGRIQNLVLGPDGHLWFADMDGNSVDRLLIQ